ncbi:hypothetical protein CONPUDRAFT_160536 [Coniophora puteana RWD-64-598 SS2]|uniref:F-box domain-containing protein n=1 Tax=Coniophora puteana (strain RWD-64-598) TaxID=741705 RepID=R7SDL4_CONPW|nr:uncharacterized protein CONPUDRAFT_160536 [Coniophora puteana RWD-64-598 SS2]EIW73970.1 hypothetical protein CONPUDRAFT_160536 [Coniophora puteana RWD-64-598 SS2]
MLHSLQHSCRSALSIRGVSAHVQTFTGALSRFLSPQPLESVAIRDTYQGDAILASDDMLWIRSLSPFSKLTLLHILRGRPGDRYISLQGWELLDAVRSWSLLSDLRMHALKHMLMLQELVDLIISLPHLAILDIDTTVTLESVEALFFWRR